MNEQCEIHTYWNGQANLGLAAGTRDLIAKELEIEAISKYAKDGIRVLDAGCGNGITAIEIASRFDVAMEGFDFAEEMIMEAKTKTANSKLKGSVNFQVADIRNTPKNLGYFELIYTERALINLRNWPEQKNAIAGLCRLLVDGGLYVMCENSQDGLDRVNLLRENLGIRKIDPPWHNRYLLDAEIEQCMMPGIELERVEHFTSTYHLLSRVINAWLAEQEGSEPDYNAPVNQLALHLPPIGDLGQTKIWLWRKVNSSCHHFN